MGDPGVTDEAAARTVREERALSPMRKTIAGRLEQSYREAVHVTLSRSVDAEALLRAVDDADETAEGGNPSMVDGLLCALSDALEAHPAFNATFEDGTHVLYEEHNVGVAVAIEDGLVTPVLADVGSKSLGELASERRQLTERVKAGEYTMSTFRGGTFTVSNLGPLGVDSFDPVINPPEVAILGLGRVTERATRAEDGVAFRRRLPLDLSFDHRVVDGADAARFLGTLTERLDAADEYV
ncbi:2-oxo acid dehydrogenase subunit E2 [Haloarcula onubensis]|uniref:2-oxo acid dehydrogenase subunit E2 n=1 Tax=Haloarcula onubensis TaxID=2950539 RepID=A0ABU2FJY3_9EURY|nr:2-oxo acid dehydrogenase subunit E2 [Halomicroarcula sp. S3CR25-11]MDS0281064.1 2-oxo acid dehydrogenase subunit E2 [Halomicroarcula sp. S3CR25-11]